MGSWGDLHDGNCRLKGMGRWDWKVVRNDWLEELEQKGCYSWVD